MDAKFLCTFVYLFLSVETYVEVSNTRCICIYLPCAFVGLNKNYLYSLMIIDNAKRNLFYNEIIHCQLFQYCFIAVT